MADTSHSDVLSNLPVWVQVAANLGMFVVAVVVSAYGFVKRLGNGSQPQFSIADHHFEEGGALHEAGSMFRSLIEAQHRIADAMELQLERQRKRDEEDLIEREVSRRLHDIGKNHNS